MLLLGVKVAKLHPNAIRSLEGENLFLPHSRPMPSIAPRCHELRISDSDKTWRIIYRIDEDAILILEVFQKTTQKTPTSIIQNCLRRMKQYDEI